MVKGSKSLNYRVGSKTLKTFKLKKTVNRATKSTDLLIYLLRHRFRTKEFFIMSLSNKAGTSLGM